MGMQPVPGGMAGEGSLARQILDSTLDAVVLIDSSGTVREWNARAEAIFGLAASEAIGRPMADLIIPERYREAHHRGLARFLATGQGTLLGRRMELSALRRDGEEFPVELTISPIRPDGETLFIGFLRDQTEEKKTQGRLQVQNTLYRLLSGSPDPATIEASLLEAVCGLDPWLAGASWRPEGDALRCSFFRERAGRSFPRFRARTLDLALRPGEGLPGRAHALRAPVWIADARGEERLPRLDIGIEEGLHSAFAIPVLARGETALVFEFFSRAPRAPDEELLAFAATLAGHLGLYLERRAVEEENGRNARRFRAITEATTDVVLIVDVGGTVTYASGSLERLLGYADSQLIGTDGFAIVHPDDRGRAGAVLGTILTEAGSELGLEMRVRRKDGTWRWMDVRAVNLLQDPVIGGILASLRDITERRAAQDERESLLRELERERARLSAILDFTPIALVLVEPGTGRIVFANKAARLISGPSAPIGDATRIFAPDSFGSKEGRTLAPDELPSARVGRGETLVDLEVDWTRNGVKHALLLNSYTLKDKDGKPEISVLAFQDLTHVKQVEEQLRQSQKMEAIGQLAGGIAHDFNNLLTAINGYSSMALEQLDPADPLHGFMSEVLRSGERAAGLTRQLLAYSRKQVLETRLWDINVIVGGMQAMLRRIIGEDIHLVTELMPGPAMAKVDRGQVEQILLNLSLNSRDAMPGGGRLIVETRRVELDGPYVSVHPEASAGRHVAISVSDTGTGMTPEVKSKAFEPFFTTKEVGKGTGLGLSSVYGIVKQSGGSLSVYSEPGHGTTVTLYFPEAAEAARSEAPAPPTRSYRGGETVLLVEDEEAVRRFAAQALEVQGYTVLKAANGREALEILGRQSPLPSLVVTDVVMPDMGGPVLADGIRALRPDLPILFISGYTESAVIHRGFLDRDGDGPGAFLQKPFGPTDLARAVREALDRAGAGQGAMERKASEKS